MHDTVGQLEFFECGDSAHNLGVGCTSVDVIKCIHNDL